MKHDLHPLTSWIPCKIKADDGTLLVQWLYVADGDFTEPFFDESIGKYRSLPYNSSRYKSCSSLESMLEWADTLPELIPAAFIFHISRCGSTLLSQLIGLDKKYITLSEVPFFDQVLRLHYTVNSADEAYRKKLFDAALKFIGKNNADEEQHVFIKTDCWHIFFQRLFRELYPSAPFVLLYRSPDEVLASHQKMRGIQAVPNLIEPNLLGFDEEEIKEYNLDEYTAKVLEKILTAFKTCKENDENTLLLDYKQGAVAMTEQVAAQLKIAWTAAHVQQMKERSGFHSKYPGQNFEKERFEKIIPGYLEVAMRLYREFI